MTTAPDAVTRHVTSRERWEVHGEGNCWLTTHSRERAEEYAEKISRTTRTVDIVHVVTTTERVK